MNRRQLLSGGLGAGAGLVALGGCAGARPGYAPWAPSFAPIRATPDRLFDITVCLRPFRAAGPRLDVEQLGDKRVVHNYGHGGSGWSLSWGSGSIAVQKAMEASPAEIAVIGCGALGLTAALLAQRAGVKVTIYARDLLPQTRSARATGAWTPDSRIALADAAGTGFGDLWEAMARTSFKMFRSYLGLPGDPVEWIERYSVSDTPLQFPRPERPLGKGEPAFGHYNDRLRDLTPRSVAMPPGSTPFDAPHVYRSELLMFNVANYGHALLSDFYAAGGKTRRMEFRTPADIAKLPERVVINCPGYGARALWQDESIVPVRGQIGWLVPQAEVHYGVAYRDVNLLPRHDGFMVQAMEGGDMKGYGESDETPDRAESEAAVTKIAELFSRFGRKRRR